MTNISLVSTTNRREGVARATKLYGTNPVKEKSVILKPNFNTADPAPGSTHNETLQALVASLKEMGATKITLAERSGPTDSTQNIMEQKG